MTPVPDRVALRQETPVSRVAPVRRHRNSQHRSTLPNTKGYRRDNLLLCSRPTCNLPVANLIRPARPRLARHLCSRYRTSRRPGNRLLRHNRMASRLRKSAGLDLKRQHKTLRRRRRLHPSRSNRNRSNRSRFNRSRSNRNLRRKRSKHRSRRKPRAAQRHRRFPNRPRPKRRPKLRRATSHNRPTRRNHPTGRRVRLRRSKHRPETPVRRVMGPWPKPQTPPRRDRSC